MIYFASDFHLGAPNEQASSVRERRLLKWLEVVQTDATELYLVGDFFDMWYEYRTVVPKGYVRILGKLAAMSDAGIKIYAFLGNHDMWMFGYFERELGITVFAEPIVREWNGKRFFIGHGDGLGPGDTKYKMLKKVFRNPVCQWLFGWLHPDIGLGIANYWSRRSRSVNGEADSIFVSKEKEWLYHYCLRKLETVHYDFFIFGHRHLPLDIAIETTPNHSQNEKESRYINLGDWLKYNTYAVFDGTNCVLKEFPAV